MKQLSSLAAALAALFLTGCPIPDTEADNHQDEIADNIFFAKYNPSASVLPFPIDLLFTGTTDGTLNIPVESATDFSDPAVGLNTLDGFSTTAPWSTTFAGEVDPTTVVAGTTVRMFELTTAIVNGSRVPTGIAGELGLTQYAVSASSSTVGGVTTSSLAIVPLQPLSPATTYMAVVTTGVENTNGDPIEADSIYALTTLSTPLIDGEGQTHVPAILSQAANQPAVLSGDVSKQDMANQLAASLESLRQLNVGLETLAQAAGIDPAANILSWMATTQSIGESLALVADAAVASTDHGFVGLGEVAPVTQADQYVGYIALPSYLETGETNPLLVLNATWENSLGTPVHSANLVTAEPQLVSTMNVPVLITVPNGNTAFTKPAGGWPVVIFQHGITSNRTALLGIANTLANIGYAAIAIDLPLHGVPTSGGLEAYRVTGIPDVTVNERTFDVDFLTQVNGVTTASAPDGVEDSSGAHFINLANLVTSKDNNRQAVADLLVLEKTIADFDIDNNPATQDFASDNYVFVGHSLGAMVGAVYVAHSEMIDIAVLGMPGGGTAKLLDASITFGSSIAAGLQAAAGLERWSADYEAFFVAAQTIIDGSDPLNYINANLLGTPTLVFEVVGGPAGVTDLVIPNNVVNGSTVTVGTTDYTYSGATAPLSGTDPLLALTGISQTVITATVNDAAGIRGVTRITEGTHGSLLTPADSLNAYTEMQTQVASFIGSNGQTVTVTDNTVVEQ